MTILKRYTNGLSISMLAAAALCMAAPAALAQEQAPAVSRAASIPENLLGAFRLPPLPGLAQIALIVSEKAELDAQTQMVVMFTLSQLGYPNFPGVSPVENMTLFVLKGEAQTGSAGIEAQIGAPLFVVFAKVAADSPVREVLKAQGLHVTDREGWMLVAPDPAAFASIEDFSSMAAIAGSARHFDIEARIYSSKAVKDAISAAAETNIAKQEAEGGEAGQLAAKKARGWLQFALKVLDQGEWVGYGLSLDRENVSAGMVLAPRADTAAARFVNTPLAAGKVKAGEFFDANAAVGYVAKYDIPATINWIQSFAALAKDMPDAQLAALIQDAIDQYCAVVSASDGGGAGIVTGFDIKAETVHTQSVQTGKFELAKLDALYDYVINKMVPDVVALLNPEGAALFKDSLNAKVKTDVAEVAGQSVSAMVYTAPAAEGEAKPATQETYYMVIKGAVLAADNLDSLKALATTYTAGKPVANNLADAYPLPANTWIKGGLDIKRFARFIAQILNEDDQAAVPAWVGQLEALDIKPVLFDLKSERGRAVYSASLSLDSVVKLLKLNAANSGAGVEEVEITEVQVTPAN